MILGNKSIRLNKIVFYFPAMETIRDVGKNLTPFRKPTPSPFDRVTWFCGIDTADFGAKGATGRLGNIAGTKNPESSNGLHGFHERPDRNTDD